MDMNLNLSKVPWYGQVGLFLALSAGAMGAFYNWYAVPAQVSFDERQVQLAGLQAQIQTAQATAERLPEFRREIAALEGQLESLRAVLPEEQDVADLLRRVQGMATQSNLRIRGFTPHAATRQQLHMEWPIGLQLEGTYHDLGDFLERVSKFPRIINVGDIQIQANDREGDAATITAECTATTFVLIDAPAGATQAAAPPPAATE